MYTVITLADGTFKACCSIQDGTEYCNMATLEMACHWLIKMARQLNHEYIRHDDIVVRNEEPPVGQAPTIAELTLLSRIRNKELVVLGHDDIRIKLRLTTEEIETIIGLREGECKVVSRGL